MSMTAGSVTFDEDDNLVTSAGLAVALYEADIATMAFPTVPTLGSTTPPYTANRPATASDIQIANDGAQLMREDAARRATAYASALVAYIQANAVARVTTESLGRTPDPNNADTAIQPPLATVNIPIF